MFMTFIHCFFLFTVSVRLFSHCFLLRKRFHVFKSKVSVFMSNKPKTVLGSRLAQSGRVLA